MVTPLPRAYASTPAALIETAERLFGEHGIEAVSTRQIMLAAGVGNKSALTYHFGTRAALVRAIWANRLPTLDARRQAMLDDLRRRGAERDPHELMKLLVVPNYELRDAQGVHRYAAFFRHALRWPEGRALRAEFISATPASQAALELFQAIAADVPAALLHERLRHSTTMFFDMIAERDRDMAEGRPIAPEAAFLAEGVDMLVACCLRPPVVPSGM